MRPEDGVDWMTSTRSEFSQPMCGTPLMPMLWYTCFPTYMIHPHLSAVLGFFVPYFDLDVILLATPPCELLVSLTTSDSNMTYQIQRSAYQMVLHTRTILRSSTSYHYNRMLLYIVPCNAISSCQFTPLSPPMLCHTFTRNICRNDFPSTQSHPRNLPLPRIWFLRLRCADFQTHTFQLGSVLQLW